MDDIIVITENLTKTYADGRVETHALRGVNLQVKRSEMVSIMGPSGCGKTTLLNLLGGLDKPTTGKIVVDGFNLTEKKDSELALFRLTKIGFIFQFYNLIPTLTALENVELPLAIMGKPFSDRRRKALKLLESVGLAEKAKRMPYELSGGEQQRVAVARALANNPSIVLADEPTGNLDSKASASLMDLIRSLNEVEEQTFIIVTHDPQVSELTDRTVYMKDGVIIEEETCVKFSQKGINEIYNEKTSILNLLDRIDHLYVKREINEYNYRKLRNKCLKELCRIEVISYQKPIQ